MNLRSEPAIAVSEPPPTPPFARASDRPLDVEGRHDVGKRQVLGDRHRHADLVDAQVRVRRDDSPAGEVDALAHQVAADTALLRLQPLLDRLERPAGLLDRLKRAQRRVRAMTDIRRPERRAHRYRRSVIGFYRMRMSKRACGGGARGRGSGGGRQGWEAEGVVMGGWARGREGRSACPMSMGACPWGNVREDRRPCGERTCPWAPAAVPVRTGGLAREDRRPCPWGPAAVPVRTGGRAREDRRACPWGPAALPVRTGGLAREHRRPCPWGPAAVPVRTGGRAREDRRPCLWGPEDVPVRTGGRACEDRRPCPWGPAAVPVRTGGRARGDREGRCGCVQTRGMPGISLSTSVATWNWSIFVSSAMMWAAAPFCSLRFSWLFALMMSASLWVKSSCKQPLSGSGHPALISKQAVGGRLRFADATHMN